MNKIEVQGGGFPGTSKTWRFIRDMINEVHDLATALGGENCIIRGCEVNNNVANEGIIIIGGEALPFLGGALLSHVEVVENIESVEYFIDSEGDGQADVIPAYFERFARFANAGTPWNALKRIIPLSEIAKRLPPKQCPLPFWGAINTIPSGWQLCDGSNGTPDLSGMFITGIDPEQEDQDTIGKTGGMSKVTLTESEMPSHFHNGSTHNAGSHSHSYLKAIEGRGYRTQSDDNPLGGNVSAQTGSSGSHQHTFVTNPKGGGQAHENRPKFYAMAWIGYVG